jgi:hypothetical protein
VTYFDADIRQWSTWQAFREHLFQHDRRICRWVGGAVIHHTWRPTPVQWRGIASMESLKRFYIAKGWTAGPHLFICAGAPNPADDGIFQLTPLNLRGVHAGVCNPTTWGIEVVGDYDKAPWSDATSDLVTHAVRALFDWRELDTTPRTLKGHRDCNSPKTCPGSAINLDYVRRQVLALDDWGYRYAR